MNATADQFRTAVSRVGGNWPTAPDFWSYSSLSTAKECPRRWALSRADYGELWSGFGYPSRPTLPALTGNVIHRCLELLLTAFQAQGCTSVTDRRAVEALRELGGYTKLVESVISAELEALQGNPRASELLPVLEKQLAREQARIRERVQVAISRAQLVRGAEGAASELDSTTSVGVGPGSHTEVELRVGELRLMGRADLITIAEHGCTITDYKTGAPSEHHAEQVRLYGLLWSRDREANPTQTPIESLVVSYATHDESFDAQPEDELDALADQLAAQISTVEEKLALRPPPASPSPETCRFCDVRHLCDEYWADVVAAQAADPHEPPGSYLDCEGEITARNGSRSWVLSREDGQGAALLRTPTESSGFAVGDRLRLLGVTVQTVQTKGGTSELIITMTQSSELFLLDGF